MKSKAKNSVLAVAALVAGLVVGSEVLACTTTGSGCTGGDFNWSLDSLRQDSDKWGTYGNSYSGNAAFGGSSIGLTVTAYSDTGTSGALKAAKVVQNPGWTTSSGSKVSTNGLGVQANSSDILPLDTSSGGYTDSLLFSFGKDITLQSLTAGWINKAPSEFSVYQYIGGIGGDSSLAGKTYKGLSSWKLVENSKFDSANTPTGVNSSGLSSSKWLIAAYNSSTTGNTSDAMVLLCIAGDAVGKVSEPSGMLLLGTAALGMLAMRRRKNGVLA